MKRLFLAIALLLSVLFSENAQAQTANSTNDQLVSEMTATDLQVYKDVNISDVQRTRISYVLNAINSQILLVQSDLSVSPELRKQKIDNLVSNKFNNMRGVLINEEQQKAFDAAVKNLQTGTK